MALRLLIVAVAGGVLGLTYYRLVGCRCGACPLTSNPYISTIYGLAMGALVASSIQ